MTFVPPPRTLPFAAGLFAAIVTAGAALAQTPAPAAATPPPLFAVCQACHESTANANASIGPTCGASAAARSAAPLASTIRRP